MEIQFDLTNNTQTRQVIFNENISYLYAPKRLIPSQKGRFWVVWDDNEEITSINLEFELQMNDFLMFVDGSTFFIKQPKKLEPSPIVLEFEFKQERLNQYKNQLKTMTEPSDIFQLEEGDYPLFLDLQNYNLLNISQTTSTIPSSSFQILKA